MNSYKKLVNNSIIFAVGTLGSKLVSFLLVPLYTYYLSTSEFGTVDLTITTVNMLIPIVSVSAYEAVLRFTMDKNKKPEVILTNSLTIALSGFLIALVFYPLFSYFNVLEGNLSYLYAILFAQMIERVLAQYTRALGKVKIFAFNGILLTFTTGLLNILFLVYFNMGIIGYYSAIILSYMLSAIFLLIATQSYKSLRLAHNSLVTIRELVHYAIPMIPNSLMWWLINASSRYFINWFVGISANGLFAVASRIPSLLNILYTVFNQAWQLSAIEEYESENKSDFYTKVFSNLSAFLFLGAFAITVVIKVVFELLFAQEYFSAWRVVPFLLLGTIFSSFSSYLGTNYVAAKQTKGVFRTSVYGGIISIVLNALLIPTIGVLGAGISSMISFFIMFLIRYFDTRQFIDLKINWLNILLNVIIIFGQFGIMMIGVNQKIELLSGAILFGVLILVNRELVSTVTKLLKLVLKK